MGSVRGSSSNCSSSLIVASHGFVFISVSVECLCVDFFSCFLSLLSLFPMLLFQCKKVCCNFQSAALPKASFWQLDFFFFFCGVCGFDVYYIFLNCFSS